MQVPRLTELPPKNHSLAAALRMGALLGAALLVAPAFAAPQDAMRAEDRAPAAGKTTQITRVTAAVAKPTSATKAAAPKVAATKVAARKTPAAQQPGPLADFGQEAAPADVVHLANWVTHTRNNKKKAFVLIDKKQAQLYVFDPHGKLKSRTAVLLGKAIGDHSVPGIGTRPMSQIKEEEKTTPAGRFLAQPGRNTSGEDIIWIDYNTAVSMHRLRTVSAEQQRAARLATPDPGDNRISYGCVNVPPSFYNGVLQPTVSKQGAFVYVLPETRTPQQLFGSFDVSNASKPVQLAAQQGTPAAVGKASR